MNVNSEKTGGNFSQLCIEGMESEAHGTNEFVPILYGQTIDQIIHDEWHFNHDAELQNIILKLCFEVKDHRNILCSISGGYDSDIMLDMLERFGGHGKTTYIFQNTGLEYEATKRHVEEIEKRYGVTVKRLRPKKPIPLCVKEFGVPFWSKYVSGMLQRLQRHGFQWEDKPFEELYKRYPRCKSALRFWCNDFKTESGRISKFNIEYVRGLKEFIIANPPDFLISPKCCNYAKKDPAHEYLDAGAFDMNCVGVRKEERGARSTTYTSCFDSRLGADQFREKTDWVKVQEATRLRALLEKKRRYEKIPGETRKLIAEQLGTTPAQVGRYDSIEKHLIPAFKTWLEEGKIGISVAYELSTLRQDVQQDVADEYFIGDKVETLTLEDVRKWKPVEREAEKKPPAGGEPGTVSEAEKVPPSPLPPPENAYVREEKTSPINPTVPPDGKIVDVPPPSSPSPAPVPSAEAVPEPEKDNEWAVLMLETLRNYCWLMDAKEGSRKVPWEEYTEAVDIAIAVLRR